MVARNHDRSNPGRTASGHSLPHLRPGRIQHTHQADEGQIFLSLLLVAVSRDLVQGAEGYPQYPLPVGCHFRICPADPFHHRLVEGDRTVAYPDPAGNVQQAIHSSFSEGHVGCITPRCVRFRGRDLCLVNGRHPLTLAGERHLRHPRPAFFQCLLLQS